MKFRVRQIIKTTERRTLLNGGFCCPRLVDHEEAGYPAILDNEFSLRQELFLFMLQPYSDWNPTCRM
jgi:hypothetical protein